MASFRTIVSEACVLLCHVSGDYEYQHANHLSNSHNMSESTVRHYTKRIIDCLV